MGGVGALFIRAAVGNAIIMNLARLAFTSFPTGRGSVAILFQTSLQRIPCKLTTMVFSAAIGNTLLEHLMCYSLALFLTSRRLNAVVGHALVKEVAS